MMNLGKSGKKIMIIIGGIKDNLTSYMPFLTRKAMAKNHSFSFFISFLLVKNQVKLEYAYRHRKT